jgi:putative flippase GtrA
MLALLRRHVPPQLFRYLLSGSSAFITEYGLFYLLFSVAEMQLYLANTLSFCGGLIVSFSLNRSWAFRNDNFHHRKSRQLIMYVVLALFNIVLTNVIIGTLKKLHVDPLIGKVITMIGIVGWNFFIFRFVIFRERQD